MPEALSISFSVGILLTCAADTSLVRALSINTLRRAWSACMQQYLAGKGHQADSLSETVHTARDLCCCSESAPESSSKAVSGADCNHHAGVDVWATCDDTVRGMLSHPAFIPDKRSRTCSNPNDAHVGEDVQGDRSSQAGRIATRFP